MLTRPSLLRCQPARESRHDSTNRFETVLHLSLEAGLRVGGTYSKLTTDARPLLSSRADARLHKTPSEAVACASTSASASANE
ncbi:hypothetical protein A1O3_09655 [Capronia epimyces CBS 606.96]|uniref:Uncharacterized protein n=1 Tax=Capronia epimyces CBS 606.96 TaxID=1182542 RepID=W9Y4R2_9EURO|nr:uncharacterized protein A1O3_09655 [Capronia epimyces CBS 606.96]EXJ77429.1 hypothetical protein A1O3_09655 [Capronia epimyces CBS 606.96]